MIYFFFACATHTKQIVPIPTGQIQPGKVRVTVSRPDTYIGSLCAHEIYDKNTVIGELGNGGTLVWDRVGDRNLRVKGKSTGGQCPHIYSVTIVPQEGQHYKYNLQIPMLNPQEGLKLSSGVPSPSTYGVIQNTDQSPKSTSQTFNSANQGIDEGLKQTIEILESDTNITTLRNVCIKKTASCSIHSRYQDKTSSDRPC